MEEELVKVETLTEITEPEETADGQEIEASEPSAEPEEEFQIPEQPPNETHTCVKENEQELVYYLYEEPNTQEGLKCELLYIHTKNTGDARNQENYCRNFLTAALKQKIVEEGYNCECSTPEVPEGGITQIIINQVTEDEYTCEIPQK